MQNKTVKKYIGLFFFSIILIGIYKTWNTEFIGQFFSLLTPLFTGILISYLLYRPCLKLEKLIRRIPFKLIAKFSRVISVISIYLITILLLYLGISLLIPYLFQNIAELVSVQLPKALNQLVDFVEGHDFGGYNIDMDVVVNEITGKLSKDTIQNFISFENIISYIKEIANISSALVNTFIGIIISVYLILDREKYFSLGNRLLACIFRPEIKNEIIKYLHKVSEFIGRYIYCRFLDATIMFFISLIALKILGIEYAIVLATVVAVCNIVPYVGSIISTIILILVTLFSEGPQKAVVVGIVMLILQQIDGNIIDPFIVKDKLKISPVLVILAVIIGGGFGGVIGIMLGVPIIAVIKIITADLLHRREIVVKYRERHNNPAAIHYFGFDDKNNIFGQQIKKHNQEL